MSKSMCHKPHHWLVLVVCLLVAYLVDHVAASQNKKGKANIIINTGGKHEEKHKEYIPVPYPVPVPVHVPVHEPHKKEHEKHGYEDGEEGDEEGGGEDSRRTNVLRHPPPQFYAHLARLNQLTSQIGPFQLPDQHGGQFHHNHQASKEQESNLNSLHGGGQHQTGSAGPKSAYGSESASNVNSQSNQGFGFDSNIAPKPYAFGSRPPFGYSSPSFDRFMQAHSNANGGGGQMIPQSSQLTGFGANPAYANAAATQQMNRYAAMAASRMNQARLMSQNPFLSSASLEMPFRMASANFINEIPYGNPNLLGSQFLDPRLFQSKLFETQYNQDIPLGLSPDSPILAADTPEYGDHRQHHDHVRGKDHYRQSANHLSHMKHSTQIEDSLFKEHQAAQSADAKRKPVPKNNVRIYNSAYGPHHDAAIEYEPTYEAGKSKSVDSKTTRDATTTRGQDDQSKAARVVSYSTPSPGLADAAAAADSYNEETSSPAPYRSTRQHHHPSSHATKYGSRGSSVAAAASSTSVEHQTAAATSIIPGYPEYKVL